MHEHTKTKDSVRDIPYRIRTDHLNVEERINLKTQYADVFYEEGEPLTFINKVKRNIRTHDKILLYTNSCRCPVVHQQEVREQIQNNITKKILQKNIIIYGHEILLGVHLFG